MKEQIKTAALILLCLSALYLLGRTWVYDNKLIEGTRFASNPVIAAFLGLEYKPETEVFAPLRLDYSPAAVIPARCTVYRDGERTGAQYDNEARLVYELFKPMLASALDSAEDARVCDEDKWKDAVCRDSVYFEFTGRLPIQLLTAWLPAESRDGTDIEAICLSFSDNGTASLLWIDADGLFWSAAVRAQPDNWPELPELEPCFFAFESDESYASVLPARQLLMDVSTPRETFAVSDPPDIRQDLSVYTPFLEALGVFPLGTPFYPRGDTRVYVDVDGGRSCEISPDGTILYSFNAVVSEGDWGYVPNDVRAPAGAALRAWEVLSLLAPAMGDAHFEISRIVQTSSAVMVEFMVTLNGLPLTWQPAVITIEDNAVRKVSLRLCRVTQGEDMRAPLPLKQAAALLSENDYSINSRLDLCYAVGDGGTALLEWAVRQ